MNAIDSVLTDLIDYAGLYPPAGLDMPSAVMNYKAYRVGEHASALGRFVVNLNRLSELREVAGDSLGDLPLSVVASATTDWDCLRRYINEGFRIDSIELKVADSAEITRASNCIPSGLTAYFEIPFEDCAPEMLDVISATGVRAKLRMGGVVADAFPAIEAVAKILKAMATRRIVFKATAGLHHPIRGPYRFTYETGSLTGTMHGFLNLGCAAALLYFGGDTSDAQRLLDEQDPSSWQMEEDAMSWKSLHWNANQLHEVRREFLTSFGSCSFEEPIRDLEALGWL